MVQTLSFIDMIVFLLRRVRFFIVGGVIAAEGVSYGEDAGDCVVGQMEEPKVSSPSFVDGDDMDMPTALPGLYFTK